MGEIDSAPYLDQLSVHPNHSRRGIGRALLEHACTVVARAGGTELILTTYSHLPWNAPFYERCGFVPLPDSELGPALRSLILPQRAVFPAPDYRIAMRRRLVSR